MASLTDTERLRGFLDDLKKIIPDISENIFRGSLFNEDYYIEEINSIIEENLSYIYDLKYIYEWMGIHTGLITDGVYSGLNFAEFLKIYRLYDGAAQIIYTLVVTLEDYMNKEEEGQKKEPLLLMNK